MMARPTEDMIETYMSLTGASHSLTLQKLEEHGGDLNEAVNAHFREGDVHITSPASTSSPQYNFPQVSNQNQVAPQQGLLLLLSAARSFKPSLLLDHFNAGNEQTHLSGQRPTIPDVARAELDASRYGNDVEEDMIQDAIEASKREAEMGSPNVRNRNLNVSGNGHSGEKVSEENSDFDRAVSLSLKTAEQEKAIREMQLNNKNQEPGVYSTWKRGRSHQDGAEVVEQQLVSQDKSKHDGGNHLRLGKLAIPSDELGSLSPKELDEAVMLETALFGESSNAPNMQPVHGSSSSSLSARQVLREQQNDQYLASLLADKEKEMNAVNEAATCQLKEDANKRIEPMEFERRLAAKNASLPSEPAADDENAVTLLVRMPNGSRLSRRFRKSDKLKFLFDFIDVGRMVEPGTYRVVRSYPRHAFTADNSLLTLRELGLTNKQEALFLELKSDGKKTDGSSDSELQKGLPKEKTAEELLKQAQAEWSSKLSSVVPDTESFEVFIKARLDKSRKSLDKKGNYVPDVPRELADLWALNEYNRIDLRTGGVVLRNYRVDSDGLALMMKDNELNPMALKDVAYSVILVKLVNSGIIVPDEEVDQPANPAAFGTASSSGVLQTVGLAVEDAEAKKKLMGIITQKKIDKFASLAKSMMVCALHAYAQGKFDEGITWYESYTKVRGNFLSESRFHLVIKLIISSGKIGELCKLVSVGDVRLENKVLQYRLTRLSSPGLIKRSLSLIPVPEIFGYFNYEALLDYAHYEKGGVVCQIASGPLAEFCKGLIDPHLGDEIPDDTRIAELQGISDAPYHEETIRRARIILEVTNTEFGKWYQSDRANASMSASDVRFRSICKAYIASQKLAANKIEMESLALEN